jgi:hypothetical protein
MIILRTQMNPKTTPLVLAVFFTLVCTLPTAGAVPAAAIAQEEEDTSSLDEEDLARGIISDVLGDGGDDDEINDDAAADAETDDEDLTDTATVNPNQEDQTVDQTDFNEFGDNTAVSIDVGKEEEEEQLTLTPSPDDRLPSEDVVFCFEGGLILGILCSDTLEDCEFAQERFENVISECEGFETPPPPGAAFCSISEGRKNIKCESRN